jgi:hypothetical protein
MSKNFTDTDVTRLLAEVAVIMPAQERVVTLEHVATIDGCFAAIADDGQLNVGWLHSCNDFPEVGQQWLVRVLGIDLPTGVLIAHALMRESD